MRGWVKTASGTAYQAKHKEYMKQYRIRNKEELNTKQKARHKAIRLEVLQYYSGKEIPDCLCCGEQMFEFLHIDHINGGGLKHRRQVCGSEGLFYWLKKNHWPEGFRVLCANCNLGRQYAGGKYCPHELKQNRDMYGKSLIL